MDSKDNKSIIKIIGIALLSLILITITIFTINNEKEELAELGPEKIFVGFNEDGLYESREEMINSLNKLAEENSEEDIVDSINAIIDKVEMKEEILDNFNRKSAVEKLKEILINVADNADNVEDELTIEERLELLNDEETDIEDVLNSSVIDNMYFAEDFGKQKFNRQFAASAMLIYHEIVRDSKEEDNFDTVIQSYDEIVYLDNKFMTAHIPLDIFVGSGTGVAFEMQYIDGDWKLNPYTVMMSLNLMGILNQNN